MDNKKESIDLFRKALDEDVGKQQRIGWTDKFNFKCHDKLECWTFCCKDTNIFLTPYDMLRIRKRLNEDSHSFLDNRTSTVVDPLLNIPTVQLKMNQDDGKCPFVTESGCSIYTDRPTSCRVYPLGQAATLGSRKVKAESFYFKVDESFCKGWDETTTWGLKDWVEDQEITSYNYFNEIILNLGLHPKFASDGKVSEKEISMILLAFYDLDRFRKFVYETSFLDKIDLSDEMIEEAKSDDEFLLMLGVKWIEFALLGMRSLKLKADKPEDNQDDY